jgi:lysophospholipid acyltransferase (LPLAT)-like uncharacterized protein
MNQVVPFLGAGFIRALHATLRVRHVRSEFIESMNTMNRRYLMAFWHSHLLLMLHSRFARPISVIISQSKDGEIIARVFDYYDVDSVRGSSTRGGGAALRELLRVAGAGYNIAITPDGPKGPPRQLKDGIIYAARSTGLPVIPVAFGAARFKRLKSWDRMIVPLPFSRAIFLYGDPIVIPRDGDVETWRKTVEDRMNQLTVEVETNFERLWRLPG